METWTGLELRCYLSIEDHVDSLVDDVLGVLAQELQDLLHLGLVGQPSQADAILPGAGSDELLGYDSHGRNRRNAWKEGSLKCTSASTSSIGL